MFFEIETSQRSRNDNFYSIIASVAIFRCESRHIVKLNSDNKVQQSILYMKNLLFSYVCNKRLSKKTPRGPENYS